MLGALLLVVFILIVAGVLHYLVGAMPIIAEPFKGIIRWLILAVAAVWVIWILYQLIQGVT